MYAQSPVFYMGNKFDLLPQLAQIFPKDINVFYDLFGGSGVVSLNSKAKMIVYNEFNQNTFELFDLFLRKDSDTIINHVKNRIKEFNLIKGENRKTVFDEEKQQIAASNYVKFRQHYNDTRDVMDLYTLTFYSFSNVARFNSKGEFNMPIGNQYFNEAHKSKIRIAEKILKTRNIKTYNLDVFEIFKKNVFTENDFLYLDPPYMNTNAVYNENGGWDMEKELALLEELDMADLDGVKWCLSNVKVNKGNTNSHLLEWAERGGYRVIGMDKNYYSLGKGNAETYEICIINYETDLEGFKVIQESLF